MLKKCQHFLSGPNKYTRIASLKLAYRIEISCIFLLSYLVALYIAISMSFEAGMG